MTVHSIKKAAAGDESPDAPRITFESAWLRYPRKVAKKDAEKAWAKIKAEHHARIIAAIDQHRASESWRKDNGQFIPYFATWLRGERWTDELESDLTMGECFWNCNGNREPGRPKCSKPGATEKNGVVYCKQHGGMVN